MTINYPDYNDIEDAQLRTWNRLNTIFNIKEFAGNAASVEYVKQFDNKSKVAIMTMALYVSSKGYENTRREIMKENNLYGK